MASDVSNCMQGIEPERNETNNYQICELGGFTLSLADKSYECRIKQIRANFKVRDRIVDFSINLLSMSCYRSRRNKALMVPHLRFTTA